MKKKYLLVLLMFISLIPMQAQENTLPYREIPDDSETYTAGTVAARMIDGLGFRYYWATEGLTTADLKFKPNSVARTSGETVDHILGLSRVIVNATLQKANTKVDDSGLTFEEKRELTLINLKRAADILRDSEDISKFQIDFGSQKFPFWNAIIGPIADAIWHCGQIVSFRRSSGNPFTSNVSLFSGKLKE